MAGILDFLGESYDPFGGSGGGFTRADQLGLLGRALAGFGAGLNSGQRGLVNNNGVLTMMPSNNWGAGFSGMSDAYSQGMNDLTRRALTGSQMKTAELNRQKSQYELDQAKQQQAARDEFTAAMQSGDPARISAARQKFDPNAAYAEKFGEKPPIKLGEGEGLIDPRTYKSIVEPTPRQTDDIREYNYAKQNGFAGTFDQWMQRKRAVSGEYGMQPIWGQGADGKPAILQLGKDGKPIQVPLPQGFNLARDPIKVDLGTHYAILDPQTRQIVSTLPKNVAEEAAAKEAGKEKGAAQASLPASEMTADNMLRMIDELSTHPGRATAVGDFYGRLPEQTLVGEPRAFVNRLNQVKGGAFLEAYKTLKGGGAITEVEGAKGQAAIDRLNRATNDKEFNSALSDLRSVIEKARDVQRQKAGGKSDAPVKRLKFNPATGELE